jgi:hypothetical protein
MNIQIRRFLLTILVLCFFSLTTITYLSSAVPTPSISATALSPLEIKIAWNTLTEYASGISIERSAGRQGIFTEIKRLPSKTVSYVDTTLLPAGNYCYRTRSFVVLATSEQFSSYSNVACSATPQDRTETPFAPQHEFYVSPAGSPKGKGTSDSPWDLQTALNHPSSVKPGDMIWLEGGRYRGVFVSNLRGEAAKPIIVRSRSRQGARLDGGADLSQVVLKVENPYVLFMDLEITRSRFDRYQNISGCGKVKGAVNIHAPYVSIINCVIHDTSLGIAGWGRSQFAELYGNVIYYNGWMDRTLEQGCDHGIYIQDRKVVKDNIVFQNFRKGITVHAKTGSFLHDIELEGNVIFNNGVIRGSSFQDASQNITLGYWGGSAVSKTIENIKMLENYTYYPEDRQRSGSLLINYSTENSVIARNYWIGGTLARQGKHSHGLFDANVVVGKYVGNWTPDSEPLNSYLSWNRSFNAAIVRQNKYDAARYNVIIYNFKKQSSVSVDISPLGWQTGATYELRNVQDYFKDIVRGTYTGNGKIAVPMEGHTVAKPIGWPAPTSTFPEFGVFVLVRLSR